MQKIFMGFALVMAMLMPASLASLVVANPASAAPNPYGVTRVGRAVIYSNGFRRYARFAVRGGHTRLLRQRVMRNRWYLFKGKPRLEAWLKRWGNNRYLRNAGVYGGGSTRVFY